LSLEVAVEVVIEVVEVEPEVIEHLFQVELK
jgi:hypothetical protein